MDQDSPCGGKTPLPGECTVTVYDNGSEYWMQYEFEGRLPGSEHLAGQVSYKGFLLILHPETQKAIARHRSVRRFSPDAEGNISLDGPALFDKDGFASLGDVELGVKFKLPCLLCFADPSEGHPNPLSHLEPRPNDCHFEEPVYPSPWNGAGRYMFTYDTGVYKAVGYGDFVGGDEQPLSHWKQYLTPGPTAPISHQQGSLSWQGPGSWD